MKKIITLLAITALAVKVAASSVTLAWDRSPDGSVTGYKIYYGVGSGAYTNSVSVGNVTNATVTLPGPTGVTFYFAATAYDGSGVESTFSNETSYTVPGQAKPAPVENLKAP